MSKCPFLSTDDNKVNCFKECLLHEYENDNGECPFKAILESMEYDGVFFNKYKEFEEDSCNVLEEIYRENNFLEIFQI
ncbi:hypothetical protein [Clostridium brassicae]|uniref:Uncharacterized protein n=1 Tax=Clostridium brassicae TaxID=2999072 RepID=A0ABT4D5V9_9CLOT|nr:hypothetical protein [Clostridium brassicae]MCY6957667.1 hypothetical protein [Clostridium brassicae]